MAISKDPASVAQKWLKNLSGSTQAIKDGVMAVTVSPTQSAARQIDAYAAGVQRAIADGSYLAGLNSVTLQDWQNSMLNKGVGRIAAGASQSLPAMQNFLTQFLPHVAQGQAKLASMPRGDIQQNIQRAVMMMEHNAQFKLRK